jgi:hypothetical protein
MFGLAQSATLSSSAAKWWSKPSFTKVRRKNALLYANTFCIYNCCMEFTWSETKRAANIKAHGIDFVDATSVFDGLTFTFKDDCFF